VKKCHQYRSPDHAELPRAIPAKKQARFKRKRSGSPFMAGFQSPSTDDPTAGARIIAYIMVSP